MPGSQVPFFVTTPPTGDASNRPAPTTWVQSTISTVVSAAFAGSSGLQINGANSGGFGGGWNGKDFSIGGSATSGSGSGRLALRFDTTNNIAYIGALAPGVAWTPVNMQFSSYNFTLTGSANTGLTITAAGNATFYGNLSVVGSITTTAPASLNDNSTTVPTSAWVKSLLSNYNIGGLDAFSGPMPSFDYLFHAPDCIPPGQFTRSLAAYRTMNTGQLSLISANTPRMDHAPLTGQPIGLMTEESRTNLLLQSTSFVTSPWTLTNTSVSTTTTVAPDGSTSAFRIVPAASQSTTYIYQTFTGTANTAYTISCYFKAGELTVAGIDLYNGTDGDIFASYDLINGVVASKTNSSSVATIKSVGNGWYRCTLTFTITGTSNLQVQFARNTGSGSQGVFAWGPQVEAGSFVTSYIPTTSTSITRPADNLTVPLNTAWFNPIEGTIFVDTNVPVGLGPGGYSMLGCFTDGTNSNTITLYIDATPNLVVQINGGGSSPVTYVATTLSVGAQVKVAFNYTATTCAISVNGSTVASQTRSTTFTGLTTLNIGAWYSNNNTITSTIRRFAYIPRAVSSAQLQYLTS